MKQRVVKILKRQKHKYGYYRKIRESLNTSELNNMFGAKYANEMVKFVRDICKNNNAKYDIVVSGDKSIQLSFSILDFYDVDGNRYTTMYLYDIIFTKEYIRIADGYGMDYVFPTFYDARMGIETEDIFQMSEEEKKRAEMLRKLNSKDSLKKSEIVGTLGEFRNRFIPEHFDCYIRFHKENDMSVMMNVEELTIEVQKEGLVISPIPVILEESNEPALIPIMIACEPWKFSREELIENLAELFSIAAKMNN